MTNKRSEKIVKVLSNSLVKGLLAAILFHMVYSFIFGMLIGDKNPLLFLYKDGLKIYYMILMPILAAIPYVLSGTLMFRAQLAWNAGPMVAPRFDERASFAPFQKSETETPANKSGTIPTGENKWQLAKN